ncbi:MAG: hypothetical protein AUJ75_02185 [Candidatus Omnitrophica bacterium CG1_02_49_10]|nr:MAG: hypothetical protein AUJ75_02185 [Candidatus Omnitrophica bacterium CG1_02_49_10]
MKKRLLTVSIAESCTGGLAADIVTNKPGSSSYFKGGLVAYSNASKTDILKVPKGTLTKYGAVSPQVSSSMAKNVRRVFGTDIGVGITGICGPSGGSKAKPVGLVYISIAAKGAIKTKKFRFKGTRRAIKLESARAALKLINDII